MPSHFSDIGFPVETEEDFHALIEELAERGTEFPVAAGRYIAAPAEGPAQLWLQVDRENRLVGVNPYFAGRATLRARLERRVSRPNDSALDGAFYAWADPSDGEGGAYPFVFDLPDMARHDGLRPGAIVDLQIVAFAHTVDLFANEVAYRAMQTNEPRFAARSFIPSGLFSPGGDASTPPQAEAIFTGEIVETVRHTNPATGADYHWARVATLGGEVDLVADPSLIEGEPSPGGIVKVTCWLSGRPKEGDGSAE